MAQAPDDPDWSVWSLADAVDLQDAVALSLGIGPGGRNHQYAKTGKALHSLARPGKDDYHDRLRLSLSHLGRDLPLAEARLPPDRPAETNKVRLVDFVAFASRMGWDIDDHFPWKELSYVDDKGNEVTLVNVEGRQMVRTPAGGYITQEQFKDMTTPHRELPPPGIAITTSIKEAASSNVSVIRRVPTSKAKPDWETWGSIPDTTIANAVALSCDVDPSVFANEFLGVGADPSSELHQFWKRLVIASANAVNGALKRVRGNPGTGLLPPCIFDDVNLIIFSTWAEGLPYPWELPEKFPREKKSSQRQDPDPSQSVQPVQTAEPRKEETPMGDDQNETEMMGKKERETLLSIIAALVGEDGLEHPWKEAQRIEGRLVKMDVFTPKARAISGYLNEAKQAVDSRKK